MFCCPCRVVFCRCPCRVVLNMYRRMFQRCRFRSWPCLLVFCRCPRGVVFCCVPAVSCSADVPAVSCWICATACPRGVVFCRMSLSCRVEYVPPHVPAVSCCGGWKLEGSNFAKICFKKISPGLDLIYSLNLRFNLDGHNGGIRNWMKLSKLHSFISNGSFVFV